jgi:SAM-dependent methyltransferase
MESLSQAASWDLVSADYERVYEPVFRELARQTLALVPPGLRAVDVAAGPGTLSFLAAAHGAQVDAIDFSPDMIAKLGARLEHEPAAIEARIGDGMSLPYPDATFDAGYSQLGLMFFPDRARGWRELGRVLKQGGRAAVTSWQPLERNQVLFTVVQWMAELTANAGLPPVPPPPRVLSDRDSCIAELREAGLRSPEVHEICAYAEFSDAPSMIAEFLRANLPFVLLKRSLGERFAAIGEQLTARAEQHFPAGPVRVEMPALLSIGTR